MAERFVSVKRRDCKEFVEVDLTKRKHQKEDRKRFSAYKVMRPEMRDGTRYQFEHSKRNSKYPRTHELFAI